MLTDTQIKAAKPKDKIYRLADAYGLCLEIKPNGVKAWRYRYRIAGKENMFAVGQYPEIGLKEARTLRDSAAALVKQGLHPSQHRQLQRITRANELNDTFEGVAREWLLYNKPHWSNGYLAQVTRRLEVDAFPDIGKLPVKDVKPAHLLELIRKIEKRSPTQAKLIQTWVGGVFRYSVVNLRRDDDPTFPLRRLVKTTQVQHHAILKTEKEIGSFLRAMEGAVGEFATKSAFWLLWMTLCRVNELTGARWDEFDFERKIWTIPSDRMKAKAEHLIPLPAEAITILESLKPLSGTCVHVFPHRSDRRRSMSPEALRDLFRRAGYEGRFTPHGVRGTFSTLANGAKFRFDAIELCLAHKDKDPIRRAYNHAPLLEERRELLQWWVDATNAMKKNENVVALRGVA